MKLKKEELLKALEIVKPGLAGKEIIEQTTSFAFINGNVVTYNDEISISCPIDGLKITGAIKAEELHKLLGKIKKDEIELTVSDTGIQITSGKGKADFVMQTEVKLPLDEIANKSDWVELPGDFADNLMFGLQSCSNDMSRPVLTCVHINPKGYIESSDGFCITRTKQKIKGLGDSVLIPGRSAMEVARMKPINMAFGDGWVHFQTHEGAVISCRVFPGKYPDVGAHLEVKGAKVTLPKTILEMIDRAAVFGKRDHFLDEEIKIGLADKKMLVSGESEIGSKWEEAANIRYTDEPVEFSITPYLLAQIIKDTRDCVLGENSIKFETETWEYIAILRVK